jgi:hypothetical protein
MTASSVETGWLSDFTACSNTTLSIESRDAVMTTWLPHANSELLEPVNDIMGPVIEQNGAVNDTVKYLGQAQGKWLGVPSCVGSQIKCPCSRIDLKSTPISMSRKCIRPAARRKLTTGPWQRS